MLYSWYQNIEFAQPKAFILLLLLPVMIWWYISNINKQQSAMMLSSLSLLRKTGSWKSTFRHLPFIFRLLSIACIIVAIARPQSRNDEEIKAGEGVDIVLCMDISGSMLAQDLTPNRFEAAKQMAADFVDQRATDRMGVVIFAGESFTLVPLTTDKNILRTQIYALQRGLLEDGTAIGDGITTSVDRLRQSTTKSRIIILLTDGENQGGLIDPQAAKEIAKSIGIKIYTVGIGTEGYAPVPSYSSTGEPTMQQQKVNIDEKLLRQIAAETGGLYFRARDNEGLKNIYSEIDKLEKTKIEVTTLKRYTEKFFPFAIAAAVFLFLEMILRFTVFKKFP